MPRYPYRDLGTGLGRDFRNNLNANFDDIEADLREIQSDLDAKESRLTQIENESIDRDNDLDARIDNLILSAGDSSPEVADARYDSRTNTTYTTLKDRLDSHSNEIGILSRKSQNMWIDLVEDYSADRTGVMDVSTLLQNAINSLTSGGVVFCPDGTYYLSSPVQFKSGVTILGGENTVFKSDYSGSDVGIFQMYGTIDDTTYPLPNDVNESTNTITLPTGAGVNFNAGDFVFISQNDGVAQEEKYLGELLEVKAVSGDTLILKQVVGHNYQVANGVKIQKVTPIKNAKLKNVQIDCMNTLNRTHGFHLNYTVGCLIENVKIKNSSGRQPIERSIEFKVKDVEVQDPSKTDVGHGYALFVSQSAYGEIEKVHGKNTRHTVDFAGGSHDIEVIMSKGFNNVTASFSSHGQNCKRLHFDLCKAIGGAYGFAFGNSSFLSDSDISVSNSIAYGCTVDGFTYSNSSKDGTFINCQAIKCLNGFNIITASGVKLSGVKAKDCSNRGISIDNNVNNISVDIELIGTFGASGVFIGRTASDVELILKGKPTVGLDVVEIGSDNSDATKNITIVNSNFEAIGGYADKKAIRCRNAVYNVKIQGSKIKGNVLYANTSGRFVFKSNELDGTIDCRATSGVNYSDNIGTITVANMPAHNGISVIRQNNLENVS
jgi:Pectate lyase superfamily protein